MIRFRGKHANTWVDCIPIETAQITRVHWTGPDSCCSAAVFSWRLPLCSGERRRRRKGGGSWCGCCHEAGVRTQQLTSSARRRLGTSGRIIWTICTILYDPAAIFIFWVVFGWFLLLSQIFPSDFEDWYIFIYLHLLNQQQNATNITNISCRIPGWWTSSGHSSSKFEKVEI